MKYKHKEMKRSILAFQITKENAKRIGFWPSWAQKAMEGYGKNTIGRDFFENLFADTVNGIIDIEIGDYITLDLSNEIGVISQKELEEQYVQDDVGSLKLPVAFHPDHDLHVIPNEEEGCDSGDCSSCDHFRIDVDDDDTDPDLSWYRLYRS